MNLYIVTMGSSIYYVTTEGGGVRGLVTFGDGGGGGVRGTGDVTSGFLKVYFEHINKVKFSM